MDKQNTNTNANPNWVHVESALNEGTASGYKIAIIETEKIFSQAMEGKGFLGKHVFKQYQKARHLFKNPEKIDRANAMFKKIINHPGFNISSEDTKEIIRNLFEAISELEKLNGKSKGIGGVFGKIGRKINSAYQGAIKKWLFYFAAFCFITLFLSKTNFGKWTTAKIVGFVDFLTFKIIVPAGLVILAVYVLIAGIRYFKQK